MEFKNRQLTSRPLFPIGVNVLVIRDGKLLLGKRKSARHDGEWGVPGGHLEEGESILGCAARELKEETGIKASRFKLAVIANDPHQEEFHYLHFAFLAEDAEGEAQLAEPDECYEWGWFDLQNLPEPLFIGHKRFIKGFIDGDTFLG